MASDPVPDMTLFARVADGVVVSGMVDERAFIVYANSVFAAMTGYTEDELVGRDYSMVAVSRTDPFTAGFLRESLRHGREFRAILTCYRKDGTPFAHEMTVLPLRTSSGEVSCVLGIHRAITRTAGGARAQGGERSAHQVERTRADACGDLLHDVRGSLSAMLSLASVLGTTLSEPRQLAWLRAIERNGRACERLLNGRGVEREVVAVSADLADRLLRSRGDADLSGRCVLVADDDEGVCDAVRIALTQRGADVVTAGDGASAVMRALAGAADKRAFDLLILDIELPEKSGFEVAAELRQRGYRGMILALTASVRPGDAERCLDAGCDVYVAKPFAGSRLPAIVDECCKAGCDRNVEAGETGRRITPAHGQGDRSGKRVLIVDDNPDTLGALARLLERRGHEPRTATDGLSAVDLCATFSPDVALIDLRLPDMDGHVLLARLRELHADLTAFAVTGLDSPLARVRALERGFADLFVKPVDFEQLERAISV